MVIDEATELAFKRYRDALILKGYQPNNLADEEFHLLSKKDQLSHVLWMCEECLKPETKHWSIDKKSRWLGFIQCTMIMNGLTTIAQERAITRPWFRGVDNPEQVG